jgi:DnaJ-class molecular chaperone
VSYTHYDYLELAPGSPPARIEAAYAQVLERFGYGADAAGHDLSGLVRMIHAAYDVLSNPDKRQRYDARLAEEAAAADAELKALLDKEAETTVRCVQDVPKALATAIARAA